MLGTLAVASSGCAGLGGRQELARLKSQVGLLEDRVTQLEQSSAGLAMPGTGALESAAPMPEGSSVAFESAPSKSGTGTLKSATTAAGLKPSTREIQQALKNAGFYQGAIDGKMGPMTRGAVQEFQRVHGLADDGVVGKQTWAKLSLYVNLSPDSGEATAAEPLK